MTIVQVIATVLMSLGVPLAVVAVIGMHRFDNVLARMHATSKPQTLGLMLVLSGTALAVGSWALAGMLLLVLLAQMITVPAASSMVGRSAFRRGFVRGSDYAFDDLSPRLAGTDDDDDDEDGFVNEFEDDEDGTIAIQSEDMFPSNVVAPEADESDLSLVNWDEPEQESDDDDGLDVDIADETEREAGEIADVDAQQRSAREQRERKPRRPEA